MRIKLLAILALSAGAANADKAMQVQDAVWANDMIYDTIVTDKAFSAAPGNSVGTLYDFSMSGLMGQRSVSDAAPESTGYKGGRWAIKKVVFTAQGLSVHDSDGDGIANFELTNASAIESHAQFGHLEVIDTGMYVSMPLIP